MVRILVPQFVAMSQIVPERGFQPVFAAGSSIARNSPTQNESTWVRRFQRTTPGRFLPDRELELVGYRSEPLIAILHRKVLLSRLVTVQHNQLPWNHLHQSPMTLWRRLFQNRRAITSWCQSIAEQQRLGSDRHVREGYPELLHGRLHSSR